MKAARIQAHDPGLPLHENKSAASHGPDSHSSSGYRDDMLVDQLKALANDTRLQIMVWLRDPAGNFPPQDHGDPVGIGVCVSHIQSKAGLSASTASTHLSILQRARLVQATRIGKWTYYRRDARAVAQLLDVVRDTI